MENKKTLRLTLPQWQGGVNPDYVLGAQLLAHIAPPSAQQENIVIPVNTSFDTALPVQEGVEGGSILSAQMQEVESVLQLKQPDRLIVFGGDCSVSQVPFDYLSGKYAGKLGILWLDAHPDVATTAETTHFHEMVLGNLLGQGQPTGINHVNHPIVPGNVLMAGLIEEELRPVDYACKKLGLQIASPEALQASSQPVLSWISENNIEYVAVHWDLDVLSPVDFRSIYPAQPYTKAEEFPAAVGRLSLQTVGRLLCDVSAKADIVGLSITEHLPWDAINLRKAFSSIPVFQG